MLNLGAVTRLRPQMTTDRNGNSRPDWSLTASSAELAKCTVAPASAPSGSAAENVGQGRLGIRFGWSLYAPVEVDVEPFDRIVTADGTFEVDGATERWRGRFGGVSGSVTKLVRVDG